MKATTLLAVLTMAGLGGTGCAGVLTAPVNGPKLDCSWGQQHASGRNHISVNGGSLDDLVVYVPDSNGRESIHIFRTGPFLMVSWAEFNADPEISWQPSMATDIADLTSSEQQILSKSFSDAVKECPHIPWAVLRKGLGLR